MRFMRTVTVWFSPAFTSTVALSTSYSKPLATSIVKVPTGAWVV